MTYKAKKDDINFHIEGLENIRSHQDDIALLKRFAERHAAPLIELLEELRQKRAADAARDTDNFIKHTNRIIVEGYSDESINAAFAHALEKISPYFSEHHDVSITVVGLLELPRGGHRATLEVHLTPMTSNKTQHLEGEDLERKHINDRDYKKRRIHNESHLKHLIHEHFLSLSGQTPHIPDYFLINIHDAELLNMMIEKEFFHATHEPVPAPANINRPQKIMVRVNNADEG